MLLLPPKPQECCRSSRVVNAACHRSVIIFLDIYRLLVFWHESAARIWLRAGSVVPWCQHYCCCSATHLAVAVGAVGALRSLASLKKPHLLRSELIQPAVLRPLGATCTGPCCCPAKTPARPEPYAKQYKKLQSYRFYALRKRWDANGAKMLIAEEWAGRCG